MVAVTRQGGTTPERKSAPLLSTTKEAFPLHKENILDLDMTTRTMGRKRFLLLVARGREVGSEVVTKIHAHTAIATWTTVMDANTKVHSDPIATLLNLPNA
jgi:hypothetical protein